MVFSDDDGRDSAVTGRLRQQRQQQQVQQTGQQAQQPLQRTATQRLPSPQPPPPPPPPQQQREPDNDGRFAYQPYHLYPSPVLTEFDRPVNQDILQTTANPNAQTGNAPGALGGLFGNAATAANTGPNTAPELSTVRICCLYNRIKDFGMLENDGDDDDRSSDEEDESVGNALNVADASPSVTTTTERPSELSGQRRRDRNGSKRRNRSPSQPKVWPKGLYYRAVKLNPMGTTAALVQGKKYLLITPYTSPLSALYKRELDRVLSGCTPIAQRRLLSRRISEQNRRLLMESYRIDDEKQLECLLSLISKLNQIEGSSTDCDAKDSRNKQRKQRRMERDESVQELYPLDRFEKWMVQEDLSDGRCGLYELRRVADINSFNIRALKRRKDSFLICLAADEEVGGGDVAANDGGNIGDDQDIAEVDMGNESIDASNSSVGVIGEGRPAAANELPANRQPSSDQQQSEVHRSRGTRQRSGKRNHAKNIESLLPCRCEINRLKSLMHRQLLCRLLAKKVSALQTLWSERCAYRPPVVASSDSPSLLTMKPPAVRRNSLLDLYSGGWNFLDIINIDSKDDNKNNCHSQPSPLQPAKKLKTFGGDNSIWSANELPTAPLPPLPAGKFPKDCELCELSEELLQLRLRLLCTLRLLQQPPQNELHTQRRRRQQPNFNTLLRPSVARPALTELLNQHLAAQPSILTESDLAVILSTESSWDTAFFETRYLLSESFRNEIEIELGRRIQLLMPEMSRSQARQRLLRAIKDMLSVMQRNLQQISTADSSVSASSSSSVAQTPPSIHSPALGELSSRSSSTSSLPSLQPPLPLQQQQQQNRNPPRNHSANQQTRQTNHGPANAPNLTMANVSSELMAEEEHGKQLTIVLDNYRLAQEVLRRVHRQYNQYFYCRSGNSEPVGILDLFKFLKA